MTTTVFCRDNLWIPASASTAGTNAAGTAGSATSITNTGWGNIKSTANPVVGGGYAFAYYPQYSWGSAGNQNYLGAGEYITAAGSAVVTYTPRIQIAGIAIYTLSGTAFAGGSPITYQAVIDVYWKPTGALVAQCMTDGAGNWTTQSRLLNYSGAYFAICRDDGRTTYNGEVLDNLTAG